MKSKNDTTKIKEQLLIKIQTPKKVCDEVYTQINSVSFKQNFKMLMGHYCSQTQSSQPSARN